MKRRTSRVTVGLALAGLWIAFAGVLVASAMAPLQQVAVVLAGAAR
jgi:hypothetical protein